MMDDGLSNYLIIVDITKTITITLDDLNCHVGAIRRVIIGGLTEEYVAKERNEAGRLVWVKR